MRSLMWFRADLRVRDNRALDAACRAADEGVVGVFTLCPKQWADHDWGAMRVDFVLRNLEALRAALLERNIPLRVLTVPWFKGVPAALLKLADELDCGALYFNDEYEVNELARDRAVQRRFDAAGLAVHRHTDQVILDVGTIRTGEGRYYSVFTPFKKKWCTVFKDEGGVSILRRPRKRPEPACAADDVPDPESVVPGHRRPDLWPAGEVEAERRLARFIERHAVDYDDQRDFPGSPGTSTLSPYLAVGAISPRVCLDAAMSANGDRLLGGRSGLTTWISELIWREFYRHVLIGFPRVCRDRAFRPATDELRWNDDPEAFEAWCNGRTGFPIIDAGMRQLLQTGWMHNRIRMIVAMFLTKDLFIDWRWGERFFMQHLVDGDFASNNGGWQWSASTGTDAAPYFRVFNPTTQSKRYDADGQYIRRFVPELADLAAKAIHDPAPDVRDECGYPEPIVDRSQTRERVTAAFQALGPA